MHHNDFKNDDNTFIELYSVKRFWWVQQSSDPDLFFNQQAGGCNQEADEGEQIPIPMAVDDHLGGEWKFCEHSKSYMMSLKWMMTMIQHWRASNRNLAM